MVPKRRLQISECSPGFRAVLFRMVPKPAKVRAMYDFSFRAVLFRMVPKLSL